MATPDATATDWIAQRLDIICASHIAAWGAAIRLLQDSTYRQSGPGGDVARDVMRTLGRAAEEVHHLRDEVRDARPKRRRKPALLSAAAGAA
jgi:hypothetical protein